MFNSILFSQSDSEPLITQEPGCFRDLNMELIISPILKRETICDLSALYYSPLKSKEDILWRQNILKDLLNNDNLEIMDSFSQEICLLAEYVKNTRDDLGSGDSWRCNYLACGHILDYSERYSKSISGLLKKLPGMKFRSKALTNAASSIQELALSDFYLRLCSAQKELRDGFDAEQYCMLIRNGSIRVKKYEGEENLSLSISSAFEKFGAEGSRDYRQALSETPYAAHVEAGVLHCLSHIYPELFEKLKNYIRDFSDFINEGLLKFCKEIRFYISWLNEIKKLKNWGLPFCFPEFNGGRLYCNNFYDLALAQDIGSKIVKNDFYLEAPEKIFIVSGPNQGGKTTFARAMGQLHYLAALGLCIPGSAANLMLSQKVLTHFERQETLTVPGGKLQDELNRLHTLLQEADGDSLVIINEIFSSTVLEDALKMAKLMLEELIRKGAICVVVSFLHELAELGPETVSLMSTLKSCESSVRSFKIIRKPPDGRAYAMTLAERHGLSYGQIIRRIAP